MYEDEVLIDRAHLQDVDYSGRSEKRWGVIESRLERCRFENLKVDDFCFGAGKSMSEYIDCSFDNSRIKALNPGRARFIRCTFRNVRLTKWLCTDNEFIDCVFTGSLKEINFSAVLKDSDQRELDRAYNRYERNDFTGATLKGVAFIGGINLLDQKLPDGDGYLFLEHAEPVITQALSQVDTWPGTPEKKEARHHLELKLDYIARGQRQLLLSPHDFTSRDGSAQRVFAQLSEVITSILADRAAGSDSVADEVTRLQVTRRALRGDPVAYFRAADTGTAMRVLEHPDGPIGQPGFDAVDAHGVEVFFVLGELLALILGRRWGPDLVPYVSVWPPAADEPETIKEYNLLPDDSPWKTSPAILQELGRDIRDTLASVDDARLPDIAAQWAQTSQLRQYSDSTPTATLTLATELVALARRARETDTWLYCWSRTKD